jgi:mannose/fructose/N-acetylgalactosamine-specific phosphotransferase system component IIC
MSASSDVRLVFTIVGGALQLVMGFFVAFSGLLVPPGAAVALIAIWLTLTVFGATHWRSGPRVTLGVPLAMVGLWLLVLTFGDLVLGWSA